MKLYVIVNQHMSAMQKAVQAVHAAVEVTWGVDDLPNDDYDEFEEWVESYQTVILLDANAVTMAEIQSHLEESDLIWNKFVDHMYGPPATTAIAILPRLDELKKMNDQTELLYPLELLHTREDKVLKMLRALPVAR